MKLFRRKRGTRDCNIPQHQQLLDYIGFDSSSLKDSGKTVQINQRSAFANVS
jgi:hypothetical protein